MFTEKGYFPFNSKPKLSEIRKKFIQFQRKCLVEKPTNKV